MCGCSGGGTGGICVGLGGHACFFPGGGMHGFFRGVACMVFPGGGMRGFFWGACMVFSRGSMHRIRRDTVNERSVCILLECILVLVSFLVGLCVTGPTGSDLRTSQCFLPVLIL